MMHSDAMKTHKTAVAPPRGRGRPALDDDRRLDARRVVRMSPKIFDWLEEKRLARRPRVSTARIVLEIFTDRYDAELAGLKPPPERPGLRRGEADDDEHHDARLTLRMNKEIADWLTEKSIARRPPVSVAHIVREILTDRYDAEHPATALDAVFR